MSHTPIPAASTLPDNIQEAYKSVIEFNKVIISITSTVLAVLISYLAFQDYELIICNLLSPIALIISISLSLFGFGYAIPAINKNRSSNIAVNCSNAGAFLMLLGIVLISTIQKHENDDIQQALMSIDKTLKVNSKNFIPSNCTNIKKNDKDYELTYKSTGFEAIVIYSTEKKCIISMSNNNK
jgi:hypothetical protein